MIKNKASKKSNKKRLIILFMFIIVVALSVGYVFKDKIFEFKALLLNQKKNDQQMVKNISVTTIATTTTDDTMPTIVQGAGKVEPIQGIEVKDLQIVSLGNVSDVDEEGKFATDLYDKTVTPVAAMLPDKEFGLVGLSTSNSEEVLINIQTTAETLVFLNPYLVSIDPKISASIMDIIKKDEKVKEFAKVIEKVLQKDVEPLDDIEYQQAFGSAIESILNTLNK